MPWNQEYRFSCKVCKRQREPGERFSARGKCSDCGPARIRANIVQQRIKAGPHYESYRRGVAKSIGMAFLDERNDAA